MKAIRQEIEGVVSMLEKMKEMALALTLTGKSFKMYSQIVARK
jgi:hypothetical protein